MSSPVQMLDPPRYNGRVTAAAPSADAVGLRPRRSPGRFVLALLGVAVVVLVFVTVALRADANEPHCPMRRPGLVCDCIFSQPIRRRPLAFAVHSPFSSQLGSWRASRLPPHVDRQVRESLHGAAYRASESAIRLHSRAYRRIWLCRIDGVKRRHDAPPSGISAKPADGPRFGGRNHDAGR